MNKERNPTFEEKRKKEGREPMDRQNTLWRTNIANECKHKWQPLGFQDNSLPSLSNAQVYCVCMKCCGYTYIETAWVGYYIGSPDLLEEEYIKEIKEEK